MWSCVEEELRGLQSQCDQRIFTFFIFNKALKAAILLKKSQSSLVRLELRHKTSQRDFFSWLEKKTKTAVGAFSSPLVIH